MQILDSVSGIGGGGTTPAATQNEPQASDAFGLSFDALLKIVLTQLTYQDPLKPMDNFQFVSQLAQFSQIQQGQEMVDSLEVLVRAQTTGQAASLLGKVVDVAAGAAPVSGKVVAVSFAGSSPTVTIETADGSTLSNLALGNVSQIREPE